MTGYGFSGGPWTIYGTVFDPKEEAVADSQPGYPAWQTTTVFIAGSLFGALQLLFERKNNGSTLSF